MVYGILRLINFAHGDIFMLGAYMVFYGVMFTSSLPSVDRRDCRGRVDGTFGIVLERLAYAPLRNSPRINVLISAIGASFLIENLAILCSADVPAPSGALHGKGAAGRRRELFSRPGHHPHRDRRFTPRPDLHHPLHQMGMAMRALSTDYEAASLMGININTVISFTFFIGSTSSQPSAAFSTAAATAAAALMGMMPGIRVLHRGGHRRDREPPRARWSAVCCSGSPRS